MLSFKRHRFPPAIITRSIWLYARFTLSLRDVEEVFAERGLDVSYETVRRWVLKFGSTIAANLRRARPKPSDHWHLDEMAVFIRGQQHWLWRAVDNEGEVLDFVVQRRRRQGRREADEETPEAVRDTALSGRDRQAAILSLCVSKPWSRRRPQAGLEGQQSR